MSQKKRISVCGYAGVYYREVPRPAGGGVERVYYIRYRRNGRQIEEKAGAQYRDGMTAAKAGRLRGLRMEGREPANAEIRASARQRAERPTYGSLWRLYEQARSANRSIKDDRARYLKYIRPALDKTPWTS